MPVCRACVHPDRNQIDLDIISGRPLRAIAASTGLSLGGLSRHREHVKQMIRERSESEKEEHGATLLSRVEVVVAEALDICSKAKADKKYAAASNALNSVTRSLELIGKLTGELQDPRTPGIHVSLHRTTNINVGCDDDNELAMLVEEATRGFDAVEIERLRRIAESQKALPICTDLAPSR